MSVGPQQRLSHPSVRGEAVAASSPSSVGGFSVVLGGGERGEELGRGERQRRRVPGVQERKFAFRYMEYAKLCDVFFLLGEFEGVQRNVNELPL